MGLFKKTQSAGPAAVADVDDDRATLQREAAKRGMAVVDLEMQLNRLRGRNLRDQLGRLEAEEKKQADAQREESEGRIDSAREMREAQEARTRAGIEEFARLAVWLARACRAPDRNPGNTGLGRFQGRIANGLVHQMREFAREANGGTPADLSVIDV